jgi:hypothetical protein
VQFEPGLVDLASHPCHRRGVRIVRIDHQPGAGSVRKKLAQQANATDRYAKICCSRCASNASIKAPVASPTIGAHP